MDMLGGMPLDAQQNRKTSRARLPSFLQTAPLRSLGPSTKIDGGTVPTA